MTPLDDAGTVEDQLAIEQLLYQYAQAFDSGDGELLAECFAPDALLTGASLTWQGDFARHLREFRRGAPVNPKTTGTHHMFTHYYAVRGARATGVTYCRATLLGQGEKPDFRNMYVRYRDELVKQEGRWQFLRRDYDILCFTEPVPARRLPAGERTENHEA